VVAATGGHPLALELFAASGLDAGAVETERYVLDTVLEDLDDASENLLRTFAVLRRPARSPEAFGATLSQLRRLVRRALLHHRDEGYLLHDLVKEFFLRRMRDLRRHEAHVQLGRITNRLAAYQDARTILAEAVREAAALAVPEVEGEALRALGGVERKLGDLPAAMGHLEQAADLLPHGSRERVRTLTDL